MDVVARDRAAADADGIRSGAPNAVQVADRWHPLRNLSNALASALDRHHRDVRTTAAAATRAAMPAYIEPEASSTLTVEPSPPDKHVIRRNRFEEAMRLHGQGWSMRRIADTLGINRQTVCTWVRSGRLPVWDQSPRGSAVDAHAVQLQQR